MKKRILALLFAVVLLCTGVLPVFPVFSVTADAADTENPEQTERDAALSAALTRNWGSAYDYVYRSNAFGARKDFGTYIMHWNEYTGEIAIENKITGQILTTNPYSIGELNPAVEGSTATYKISEGVRKRLMSQVALTYKPISDTTQGVTTFYSFSECAESGQIKVKTLKNGLRVEYTLGRADSRYLLPGLITAARYQSELLEPIQQRVIEIFDSLGLPELVTGYEDESGNWIADDGSMMDDAIAEWAAGEGIRVRRSYSAFLRMGTNSAFGGISSTSAFIEYMNDLLLVNYSSDYPTFRNIYYYYHKLDSAYTLQDPNAMLAIINNPESTAREKQAAQVSLRNMQSTYPITTKLDPSSGKDEQGNYTRYYSVYSLNNMVTGTKRLTETVVKMYCPDYGYDDVEYDHSLTEYKASNEENPLFKLAIEYTIADNGDILATIPANSIRYDATKYVVENITMLPYFGAAKMTSGGFAFYPDGSGAVVELSGMASKPQSTHTAQVYGIDYAYYQITGNHLETVRTPVYGVVGRAGSVESGYLAIVTEGDALASLTMTTGGLAHPYATIYPSFVPRAKDSYSLAGIVSSSNSGSDNMWTVVSDRKYSGNYTLRIVPLTNSTEATDAYPATWMGMATAYRDYLFRETGGALTRLGEEDVESSLPLYIETFGTITTTKKFLSIPYSAKVALTSFEDVRTMYGELSEQGITNINFKLRGYSKGGMESLYPTALKWQRAAGGADGFEELIADAKEKGYGVYPDFDFLYLSNTGWFDGISKSDLAKTVDDRYTEKQIYDPVFQTFVAYFDSCVSSSALQSLYAKFSEKYSEYSPIGISVSTLGSDLNSNFDPDEPSDRNDAKTDIMALLADMRKDYGSVMISGGNSYALKYAEHLLEAPIDSSNLSMMSYTVPFFGVALHGALNYAGSAINAAGDVDRMLLKSIESGAALYYQLSYNDENIVLLKEDEELSKFYAIRYSIWKKSLVEQYKELNFALGDLQRALITDYVFLRGERIPELSENTADAEALIAEVESTLRTVIYNAVCAKEEELRTLYENGTIESGLPIHVFFDRAAVLDSIRNSMPALVWSTSYKVQKAPAELTGEEEGDELYHTYVIGDKIAELLDAMIAEYAVDGAEFNDRSDIRVTAAPLTDYRFEVTDSCATDGRSDYSATRYTVADYSLPMVTYTDSTGATERRVSFALNYNSFDTVIRLGGSYTARIYDGETGTETTITCTESGTRTITVPSFGFVRIEY